jgi:propanol-preferring alcohol dehydrogenase
MRAWVVDKPGPMRTGPLVLLERERPEPGPGEIRIRVTACGVCRTDLHLAEGDLAPRRPATVPGHEVVGVVDAVGPDCRRFRVGQRAGVAWLRGTCGSCFWCRRGRENLCPTPTFTGWDADGGYAEWAVVHEAYAYELPDEYDDQHAAPLLCAGIVGYRALKRAELPPGGRLGIYGFGASAHLVAQVALPRAPPSTSSRGPPPPSGSLSTSVHTPPGRHTASHPNHSTPPSSSLPPGTSSPPHSPHSSAAAPWRSRASTSATSRR